MTNRGRMTDTRRIGGAERNPSWSGAKALIVSAAALLTFLLNACGERPQDINYKQGVYQGKPDSRPWDSAPFNGDQKAWEIALKDRAQAQNEYKRTN